MLVHNAAAHKCNTVYFLKVKRLLHLDVFPSTI